MLFQNMGQRFHFMSFAKKLLQLFLRYYHCLFPIITFLIPLVCLQVFSNIQKIYYLLFTLFSSAGWFFAVLRREKQLRVAAGQLLQAKIRRIMEQDEGLKKICLSVEQGQKESQLLKSKNHKLVQQLLFVRDAFMKTKGEMQRLEGMVSHLKEEGHCLRLQVEALSQETKEKDEEIQGLNRELVEALAYQQALNEEYQATFEEQHAMLDVRQMYIGKLEAKVQDLMCEIRNLLQLDANVTQELAQKRSGSTKVLPQQILAELKTIAFRVENAQAASSLTASRYVRLESSVHNYSLECRQLFDSLREENLGMLFIYAPNSRRAVFANSLFKAWTGYGVEDFLTMGNDIVVSGLSQWEADLRIQDRKERSGKLVIKTKNQGQAAFYYCLTILNKGPLHNHVLGVLCPEQANALYR